MQKISLFLVTLSTLLSFHAIASTSFECSYEEDGQARLVVTGEMEWNKIRNSRTGRQMIAYPKGAVEVKMTSDLVLGSNTPKKIEFFQRFRKNEGKLKYLKLTNKSPEEWENKTWKSPYYKISLPKFLRSNQKTFTGFFGFSNSESPVEDFDQEIDERGEDELSDYEKTDRTLRNNTDGVEELHSIKKKGELKGMPCKIVKK